MERFTDLPQPSEGELEILQVLWERGPSSVRDVYEALSLKRELVYTTTLKQMQIMTEKGLLRRTLQGKAHIYEASTQRDDTQRQLLQGFIQTAFRGSATDMVLHALGGYTPSSAELLKIRQYLDAIDSASLTHTQHPHSDESADTPAI